MSASTAPTCPLSLTADDLSAWRDHALAPDEDRRITLHTSGCPACQRTLAAHGALANALRAEPIPAPDPRNWPQISARIAQARKPAQAAAPRTQRRLRRPQRPALWGGLSATAAVLLISALFLHLFTQQASQRPGARQTVKPAATPAPLSAVAPTQPVVGPRLAWQTRMAPESVIPPPGNQFYDNGFAFSPTDAQTAYICSSTNAIGAPIAIWTTHDGGATWTHMSDLPYISEIAQCSVTVDSANPLRLNAIVSEQHVPSYLSDDGGKTWRTLSDDMQLVGLNTQGATSVAVPTPWDFATGAPINPANPAREPHLSVSYNDWRTWQPIDSGLAAQGMIVEKVWRRPGDGALLAETVQRAPSPTPTSTPSAGVNVFPTYTYRLWQSADLGALWSPFPTPANLITPQGFTVAQPQGTDAWRVCGFAKSGSGATQNGIIGCTLDGGQTWTSRPLPALKAPCPSGVANCFQLQTMNGNTSLLLPDGSLLTTFYAGPTGPGVVETMSMFHVFRLPAGASEWQDLGSQPGNSLLLLGSPASGTVVSYSGGSSPDGVSGSIVGQLGGDIPNRGSFAIATLP